MLKYNLDLSSKERILLETIFCKNGIEGNRILQRIRESQQLSGAKRILHRRTTEQIEEMYLRSKVYN
jgi:hypothetical protein